MALARRSLSSGATAAGLALALLWAANRLTPTVPFPPVSAAERVVRLTPGDVATAAIERFQHAASTLLAIGVTLVVLAILAAAPMVVAGPGRLRAPRLAATFFAVMVAMAFLDPQAPTPFTVLASCASAALVYAFAWEWLDGLHPGGQLRPDPARRRALVEIAGGIAALALGGTLLGKLAGARRGPNTDVTLRPVREPARVAHRASFPSVPGLSPEVTSARDHYVVDIDLVDPVVDADRWRLRVHGLVAQPLGLSFAELQDRYALVEEFAVLTCVSNPVGGPLVGNSKWGGVRLAEVLRDAGVKASAVDVVFRCADGYSASIPVERARAHSVLLAIAQGGRPLRQAHGFPCRVRVPELYGMLNAKWVEEIVVVDRHYRGFWAQRGWSDTAIVRTESRIDSRGGFTAGRPSWIGGVAWAGNRGISRVEVSVDGGLTWSQAMLHEPLSPYAWTQWAYRWTPPRAGNNRVLCRATDRTGQLQDRRSRPPHPSGASGYHEVDLEVS